MQPWIYFLISAAFLFLIMRGGCGAHVMGHATITIMTGIRHQARPAACQQSARRRCATRSAA